MIYMAGMIQADELMGPAGFTEQEMERHYSRDLEMLSARKGGWRPSQGVMPARLPVRCSDGIPLRSSCRPHGHDVVLRLLACACAYFRAHVRS